MFKLFFRRNVLSTRNRAPKWRSFSEKVGINVTFCFFLRPRKSHCCAEPRTLTYFTSMSVVASWLWAELIPRLHDTTGCQFVVTCVTGLTTFDDRLYRVNKHSTGCQTGCQTVLTTSWMFVYTMQPVVKPGCTTGLTTGCIHDTAGCQTGCQTGLTTG